MKNEQVVPDYIVMLESSITVLALVGCGWLLIKLVSACIWFPQYMKKLEVEADKANNHLLKTLLPKEAEQISEECKCQDPKTPEKLAKSPAIGDIKDDSEDVKNAPDLDHDLEEPKKDK